MFQGFAAPSLQIDAFDLHTGQSGQPVLVNGKHTISSKWLMTTAWTLLVLKVGALRDIL